MQPCSKIKLTTLLKASHGLASVSQNTLQVHKKPIQIDHSTLWVPWGKAELQFADRVEPYAVCTNISNSGSLGKQENPCKH